MGADKNNIYNADDITPQIKDYVSDFSENTLITPELYGKYEVKRGLRDISGKGVVAGLTEISEILSYTIADSEYVPCDGRLFYRGIDIENIVNGFLKDGRPGFDETAYLLLMGDVPDEDSLNSFSSLLSAYRTLPPNFVRDIIMKKPSRDMMNTLARSVLTLYSYDSDPDNISIDNVLRQCLQLIARFPLLAVYGFQAYSYYYNDASLVIHQPVPEISAAANILHMLRPDSAYTPQEERLLDLALVLHMEHGGGNNSTFTNHVVTSSGTDTYSAMAASLGSLKGPRHGGANIRVIEMFDDLERRVSDTEDDDAVSSYLSDLLNKKVFDGSGLIYGMGHAVYSVSDPRAIILKKLAGELAAEKGGEYQKEFELFSRVERLAPRIIASERKIYKGVSANVDFYSGFVYKMLGLPRELFTPLFASARVVGWSAHRLEELYNAGKIIRPAYKSIAKHRPYTPLSER